MSRTDGKIPPELSPPLTDSKGISVEGVDLRCLGGRVVGKLETERDRRQLSGHRRDPRPNSNSMQSFLFASGLLRSE
jgi:hypothetical protein